MEGARRTNGVRMDLRIAAEALRVIKEERERRLKCLEAIDTEPAQDRWIFEDAPFLNELLLAILIGVRHQVERELVMLSARIADDSAPISPSDFDQKVQSERQILRNGKKGWNRLKARLNLDRFPDWVDGLEDLRLIVNSVKHGPWSTPEIELLNRLGLDTNASYAPIAESDELRQALLQRLGLPTTYGWHEIATEFLGRADRFVKQVASQSFIAPLVRSRVSFDPRESLR